ncbi:TPA: hypothetical protein I8412_002810 [Citrobacter freundii]|uniref:hypothetical protein n=1 Tax=Citrobacter TaxID=544 RepID=UPI00077892CE|nr:MULTISPECIES: hypothetical protein [Citrobacter]EIC8524041.1 hypothetical protein [Salmonella enterica]KYC18790.1 hypothetical protein WM45_15160 [Citrobacter sp. AATXR]MCM8844504.1 hypothetical protein [Citrobacter cronae]MDH1934093.1 hypothetical protein [Citrobacter freundii]MDM3383060.1 hypothetical protein [Citrobacter sp. Cb011]
MITNLDSMPSNEPYLWADYIEILALTNIDRSFSRGDLYSTLQAQPEAVLAETEEAEEDSIDDIDDENDALVRRRARRSVSRNYVDRKWNFAISFVRQRIDLFGDSYPFTLSDDNDTVELRDTSEQQLRHLERLYLALLICANIKYVNIRSRREITRSFELISLPIFESLMPSGSIIKACWASGGQAAPYTGTLFNKFTNIAADIRCTPNFKERDFSRGNSGDGGLDIIAWHPMGDQRDAIPISFVQCGCSQEEWEAKQLEASPAMLYSKFPVAHRWATYYFLPQDLRWVDGEWAHKSKLGDAIFVDRLRLINLTRASENIDHSQNIGYLDILLEANAVAA